MRSFSGALRRIGMAAIMATLSVGVFAPTPLSAHQQLTDANTTNPSPCVSPPAGFNPLTASDTQLLYYGLPRRPSASSAFFDQWVMVVTHAKRRGCENHMVSSLQVSPHKPGGTKQLNGTNGYNWSGWQDNNQTYYAASGQWTIPCINTSQSPSGSDIGDWVGLGGEGNYNLLQAGTYWDHSSRTWKSFYEEVGTGSYTSGADEFATETCGHNMFAEIDYDQTYVSQSYYLVEDLTNGAYWPGHNNFAPAFNTAEWIDEASTCNNKTGDWRMFADYGYVYWSYAGAGLSYSGEHPISYWPRVQYYAVSDTNWGVTTEYAGPLNSSGNGFTDVFNNNNGGTYC